MVRVVPDITHEALVNRMQRMGHGKSYLLVADVLNDYVVPDITHGKSYLFSADVLNDYVVPDLTHGKSYLLSADVLN